MRPLKLIVKHSPSELLTFILTYHHHEYETEFVKPIFRCASTCCTDGLDSLTDSLTDSLIETGDCQFIMFDNSPTTSLVFYPKGMICLVSLVIPVSLVTLVSLVIQVSHISLVNNVSLVSPVSLVSLVSLATLCMILQLALLHNFLFYLAHLWTDFQSCFIILYLCIVHICLFVCHDDNDTRMHAPPRVAGKMSAPPRKKEALPRPAL